MACKKTTYRGLVQLRLRNSAEFQPSLRCSAMKLSPLFMSSMMLRIVKAPIDGFPYLVRKMHRFQRFRIRQAVTALSASDYSIVFGGE